MLLLCCENIANTSNRVPTFSVSPLSRASAMPAALTALSAPNGTLPGNLLQLTAYLEMRRVPRLGGKRMKAELGTFEVYSMPLGDCPERFYFAVFSPA